MASDLLSSSKRLLLSRDLRRQCKSDGAAAALKQSIPPSLYLPSSLVNHHRLVRSLLSVGDRVDAYLIFLDFLDGIPDPYSTPFSVVFIYNSILQAFLYRSPSDICRMHLYITFDAMEKSGSFLRAAAASTPSSESGSSSSSLPPLNNSRLPSPTFCSHRTHETYIWSLLSQGSLGQMAFTHYSRCVRDVEPFKFSLPIYRLLVEGLLAHDLLESALQVKDDMASRVFTGPDACVYRLIMTWLIDRRGEHGLALDMFRELETQVDGLSLDKLGIGDFIRKLLDRNEKEAAREWYEEIFRSSRIRFEPVSYNVMLEALAKDMGDLDEAVCLFRRMIKNHHPLRMPGLDAKSFDFVIGQLCSTKRFDEAIQLFIEVAKIRCRADFLIYDKFLGTLSCNKLIQLLAVNALVNEAEGVLKEMIEQKIQRNYLTYLYLVEACFVAGRIGDAIAYFREMVEADESWMLKPPDAVSYDKAISRLASALELLDQAAAREVVSKMVETEAKLNNEGYEMLTLAFCKLKRMDDALTIVRSMLLDHGLCFSKEAKERFQAASREEELVRLFEDLKRDGRKKAEESEESGENLEGTRRIQELFEQVRRRTSVESYSAA